ncbi:PREDICTED: calnexin isoform X2 [Vollenhovia emeryi]|uniref:calnexin isoform X2 n=1 Tax=Vollenhovia emeryi TaxID=411798 RepID=UPI0005F507D8|nr:PREDICTED: calnexin isoform X2 [Vollenhovia emeryi]
MARIVACVVLVCLSACCNILNADERSDGGVSDAVQKPTYKSPAPSGPAHLAEHFDSEEIFRNSWVLSEAKKDEIDEDIAKYDGIWSIEEPKKHGEDGDLGLVLKSKARHAAVSTLLTKPFYFEDKPLVVQYEVNFQDGQECGGAYLKLLTLDDKHGDLKQFQDKTPYTIMFGPDKCGNDHKLHFIFRHKNPLNGTITEKHCKKSKDRLEDYFKDKNPHLYTLIVRPDNMYEIRVDNKFHNAGSLLDDFAPPVNPPLEIEDPDDKQPEDWDDREKIPDPLAEKPDDWDEDAPAQIVDEEDVMPEGWLEDEPPMIPNPDSIKPDDWDVEMDGEWEAPDVPNPKCADVPGCGPYKQKMKKNPRYKGKWLAPLVNNPNYKGKWKPRLIHNPDFFNDEHPFRMLPISAVGFELWSMSPDIYFDNILVTDDEAIAKKWADDTFEIRRVKIAKENLGIWSRIAAYLAIDHLWLWGISVLLIAVMIVLILYYCCVTEEKLDDKDEDEKPLSGMVDEESENEIESENQQSLDPDYVEKRPIIEEIEDTEKETETEEVIEIEKDTPLISGEGPRRRKPNKE